MSQKDTEQNNAPSSQEIRDRIQIIDPNGAARAYSPVSVIGSKFDIEPGHETHLQLSLLNGKKRNIQIPIPTSSDIRWAKKIVKKDFASKSYALAEAALKNNLWRLHFLLMQNVARPKDTPDIVDINVAQKIGNYYAFTPLSYSCIQGHSDVTAMLITFGADVNASGENKRIRAPVYRALYHDQLDCLKLLIDSKAKFYPDEFAKASHPEIKEYLSKKFGHILNLENIGFCDLNNIDAVKKALPAASEKAEAEMQRETGTIWSLLGDDAIVKRDTVEKQFSLNTVFNFKSTHILRFTESLDANGNVTHISPPSPTESFSRHNKTDVAQAHEEYIQKGGKRPLTTAGQAPRQIQKRAR